MPIRRVGHARRLARRGQPLPHRFEQFRHAGAGDAGDAEEGQAQLRRAPFERGDPRRIVDRRAPRRSCSRRRSAAWPRASASNSCSSRRSVSRSSTGSRPVAPEMSTRCTSTLVRSRWRRNWWPSPRPRCAPSISPGTSATTKLRSSLRPHDAEIRRQRGEGVVGDLRAGGRDAGDERRLAGVREADEADVGEQLQLEPQILLLARFARLHLARRPIGRRREVRVAHAAAAAARDEHALAFGGEIREQRVRLVRVAGLLVDERADRHGELEIVAALAGAVRSLAVVAALGGRARDGSGS